MNYDRIEYLLNQVYYNYLSKEEANELIDYITNLEKENQKLNKYKSIVDNLINYLDKNRLVLNNPALLDFYQAIKEVE